MVSIMEGDDRDESCGCEPFPVTNAIIDGWQDLDAKICQQIDTKHNNS